MDPRATLLLSLLACGLPADYVPPWGVESIPADEQVPGAIGFGAVPVIGCPPPPPAPGEPDVRIADFQLAGSPYKEPTRRMLLQGLPSVRACYAAHATAEVAPAIHVSLAIASDGLVLDARVVAAPRVRALRECVRVELRGLRLHGAPGGARSTATYRYEI